jgi:hypothetical protein
MLFFFGVALMTLTSVCRSCFALSFSVHTHARICTHLHAHAHTCTQTHSVGFLEHVRSLRLLSRVHPSHSTTQRRDSLAKHYNITQHRDSITQRHDSMSQHRDSISQRCDSISQRHAASHSTFFRYVPELTEKSLDREHNVLRWPF